MKNTILTIALCLGLVTSAQQEDFGNVDFSFSGGFMGNTSQGLTLEEYRSFHPNSPILNKDLSNLSNSNDTYYNTSPLFNLNYGFRLKKNTNLERKIRIGISYRNYSSDNNGYYYSDSNPYDTLTSSQSGEEFYIDSSYTESLFFESYGQQLGLDFAYLFYTNPNGRWSFYTGFGAELGIGFNNKLNIVQTSYSGTSYNSNYYAPYINDYETNFYEEETYNQNNTYYGRLYAPIGLDFRISKKHEFWKRMHLYTEFKPMVEIKSNELKDVQFNPGFGWSTFGLRFEF